MANTQRGSGWSIKLVFNLYKIFGYKFIYYLMYPVTFFYFLFGSTTKKHLHNYYDHLGLEFNSRVYYEHLRVFAITMVDRFVSKVDPSSYKFMYAQQQENKRRVEEGLIMLFSHFGGWAASASSGIVEKKIHIVMQEQMLQSIKSIENTLETHSNINIIDLNSGMLSVSVQIANALIANESVVMMADRSANEKGSQSIEFLGESASFNKNPFQIAYKMNKPLLAYFIVLVGVREYRVIHSTITMDKTKKESEAITSALSEYVKVYEDVLREYPQQWFNFYDFWEKK
ncbi:MAG: lipid A biosynthesis acyltransferase [Helicobacteraceae bacterium]|nr:lipid A biosynthesis acyltransferase [Helicobacteraceae bacterium]